MSFDHKELDELDSINWPTFLWHVILVVLGFVFAGLLIWYGGNELYKYINWSDYKSAEATVLTLESRKVEGTRQEKGMMVGTVHWQLDAEYKYSVQGQNHKSWTILEIEHSETDLAEVASNHSIGEKFNVWYHPDKPGDPIVKDKIPTLFNSIFFICFGLIVLLFMIFMVWPDKK